MSAPAAASISSVWARVGDGLPHDRLALGAEPGQQDGRLHLGAGHRHVVVDALEAAAPHGERRQAAAVAPVDPGAHPAEGVGHPVHGPAGDGRVAGQHRQPVEAGAQPGQQADGGARVADVDHPVGLVQAGPAAGDRGRRRRSPPWPGRRPRCGPRRRPGRAPGRPRCPRPGRPGAGPGGRSTCRPAPAPSPQRPSALDRAGGSRQRPRPTAGSRARRGRPARPSAASRRTTMTSTPWGPSTEWAISRSTMLTPSSPRRVVTSASTPGTVGHGHPHLGQLLRHRHPGGQVHPGRPGPLQGHQQAVPVARRHQVAHAGQGARPAGRGSRRWRRGSRRRCRARWRASRPPPGSCRGSRPRPGAGRRRAPRPRRRPGP